MVSVIMAGGVGERFWPRSRRSQPKQLLDLTGQGSMISLTVERVRRVSAPDEIFIVTNVDQAEAIRRDVGSEVAPGNVIGEPEGRNTAPSIGLAAVLVEKRFGDVPFMVLPADHLVGDGDRYDAAVRGAAGYAADNDCLMTFGIKPTRPETGYGYIRRGERLAGDGELALYAARSFHEKPSAEAAREYVDDGGYCWNSGMFFWRPSMIRRAIEKYLPDLQGVLRELDGAAGTADLPAVLKSVYGSAPRISIDYGVMEKADNVVVVEVDFDWNDVGSWESIREIYPTDENGNVLVGDHLVIDGTGNTVFSPDRFVGVLGLDDIVVVDAGDAILVCRRDCVQQVREMVDRLKRASKETLI